jgi:hypothetical protein
MDGAPVLRIVRDDSGSALAASCSNRHALSPDQMRADVAPIVVAAPCASGKGGTKADYQGNLEIAKH